MEFFFKLCSVFTLGCADFFNIRIPFIDVSMFQLFAALLIIKAILVTVKIIFGTDHGLDKA